MRRRLFTFVLLGLAGFGFVCARAQDTQKQDASAAPQEAALSAQPQSTTALAPSEATKSEAQEAVIEDATNPQNVTLDFKEADIRNVLKIISYKSGVNIVATPEVIGNVTIRLVDVPWEDALQVIVKTYGYAYDKRGNIITVAPIEKLTAQKQQEAALAQVQATETEVFNLKFIDAQDARKALEAQLSPRGKITVLEMTGQAGWEFGTMEMAKRKRSGEERVGRSKVLIISDVPPALDKMRQVIENIDVVPKQIIIEARIMEVNNDFLRDIGFDFGTGQDGAHTYTNPPGPEPVGNGSTVGGRNLGSEFTPSMFGPLEGVSNLPGTYPYKAGLEILFKKLTGTQFEVILHALEEDANTNTLSAPRIMALNNQEATILIGTRYPILKTEVSGTDSTTTTVTLDYYQDIGIQLNVVPQVSAGDHINMVVHPAVTDYTTTLGENAYPIINTREAETRVYMADNETVVIGGLLKDIKRKETIGIPVLSKIPFLGAAFRRDTTDTAKVDLLIFITARIVKDGEFSPEEINRLEERMQTLAKKAVARKNKKSVRQ